MKKYRKYKFKNKILLCVSLFYINSADATVYKKDNLTADIASWVTGATINNVGDIAWNVYLNNGRDIDLFLNGVNITPNTDGEFNQIGDINDLRQVVWRRSFASPSKESDILLDGVNLTSNTLMPVGGSVINNAGDVAWLQWSGTKWDVILNGLNLTTNYKYNSDMPSLNDFGDIAWTSNGEAYLNGRLITENVDYPVYSILINNKLDLAWLKSGPDRNDIFLNGENLTANLHLTPDSGTNGADYISLNNLGQVAWRWADGNRSDIYVNGLNLTSEFQYGGYNPIINDRGQIIWGDGIDVYLATPVSIPSTLLLFLSGALGFLVFQPKFLWSKSKYCSRITCAKN